MHNLVFFWRSLLLCLGLAAGACSYGAPVISEFMASNQSVLADEDGEFSDWIEVYNPESSPISLGGYHLTDNSANLQKWTFPGVSLDAGAYMVVFASGKNRTNVTGRLHTNFELSAEGEFLALVSPDGISVVSGFATEYPAQFEDESFGLAGSSWTFFSNSTPGAPNGSGTRAGPIIEPLEKNPIQPAGGPMTVSVRVRPLNGPVTSVRVEGGPERRR